MKHGSTLVLWITMFFAPHLSAAGKPNILFILTDDQGWWDVGMRGNDDIDTPVLDRLSGEGVDFTRFYAAPVCAPTRAGLMTGRYCFRTGLYNTRFGGDTLGINEITIAQMLRRADTAPAVSESGILANTLPINRTIAALTSSLATTTVTSTSTTIPTRSSTTGSRSRPVVTSPICSPTRLLNSLRPVVTGHGSATCH